MVQWLRICQPMQGTMGSIPGTRRSPMPWSNETHVPQLVNTPKVCASQQEKSLQLEAHLLQQESNPPSHN